MQLKDMRDIRYGTVVVKSVYSGATKIWPAGPPPFTPADLAGLKIWLDAADYQPGVWLNKAFGGAAATIIGTPNPALSGTTLNGKAVVRFTVNEGRVRITSGTGVSTDWTLVYVARMVGPYAGRVVAAILPPVNLLVGFWNGNKDVMYDNGFCSNGQGAPVVMGEWKMYSGDGTTGLSRLLSNGTLLGTTSTSVGFGNSLAINGYDPTALSEMGDCEVAEVIQYNRKLSDTERQQVETYLRNKWAIV